MAMAAVTYRAGTPEDGAAMLSIHTRAIELVAVRDYGEAMARSWAHGLTADLEWHAPQPQNATSAG